MTFDLIDVKLMALVTTAFFWFWTGKKHRIMSALQQGKKGFNYQPVHLAFFSLFVLEFCTYYADSFLPKLAVSTISASVFLLFEFVSARFQESFWQKKRNRLVGGAAIMFLAALAPLFIKEAMVMPLAFSLLIVQTVHSRNSRLFKQNLKDLEAVQTKLLKMDSDLKMAKLKNDAGTPPLRPLETFAKAAAEKRYGA